MGGLFWGQLGRFWWECGLEEELGILEVLWGFFEGTGFLGGLGFRGVGFWVD